MLALTEKQEIQEWIQNRLWSQTGHYYGCNDDNDDDDATTILVPSHAAKVLFPTSTEDVAEILRSTPPSTPIACVCGGNESANLALRAEPGAVVLDLSLMDAIHSMNENDDSTAMPSLTVGPGVRFRTLAKHVRTHHGALPVGTGPEVGVVGYVVNGGSSGYFSRRLGLLGQRVTHMTVVTRDGVIRELCDSLEDTPAADDEDRDLFQCMLGAGSALGVVTSMTISLASESIFQTGGQFIVSCTTMRDAQVIAKRALVFMRDTVMADSTNDAVSMEVVITAECSVVCTLIFFDTFRGDPVDFISDLRTAASGLTVAVDNVTQWSTWFEAASSLWPVIAAMEGSPLATLQHAMGTHARPSDETLDFIAETWIGESPMDMASLSIIEARTLGGAVTEGREIPTGNGKHEFFVDMITCYDAGKLSVYDRRSIADQVDSVVERASQKDGVTVDFSGTHSQPDDVHSQVVSGEVIFGSLDLYGQVKTQKAKYDPANCFRFHPFHNIL